MFNLVSFATLDFGTALATSHAIWISLIAGFLAGEELILVLGFLSAQGMLPIWIVFIFGLIGLLVRDTLLYFVGFLRPFYKLNKYARVNKISANLDSFIQKATKQSMARMLLYTKFIFGTRILTSLYLGYKRVKPGKFIFNNAVIWAILVTIFISFGYFAGESFKFITDTFKSMTLAIAFLLLLIIIFMWAQRRMHHKMVDKTAE
jgi:membrane protein DedA with SNARE-associated domain